MEQKFCQSCGMPIDDSTFGKEADGSKNEDYCHYCYADGHFTKECTMDEMIELNLNYLDEFNKDSEVKYTGMNTYSDLIAYLLIFFYKIRKVRPVFYTKRTKITN